MAETIQATAKLSRQIFLRTMNAGRVSTRVDSSRIVELMEDLYLPAGSVIYRQGQAPERIYFVVSGTVALRTEGQDDWTFNERSVIGIIDANLERPRARTAVAVTNVHLLAVRVEDYFEVLEDNYEQQRGIVYNVAIGVREVVGALAPDGGFSEPPASALERVELKPLTPVDRIMALRQVGSFRRASIQAVTELAKLVEELRVPEGPTDLRPGLKNGSLLVVARGAVEMVRTSPLLRAKFAAPSMIGGISTLADESEIKLTALVPSILLRLREEDLFDVMEDHFDLTRSVLADSSLERERLMPLKLKRAKS